MDLYTFIQKLKALKDAALAGNWSTVVKDGLPLIVLLIESWTGPRPVLASGDPRSVEELCRDIDKFCAMTYSSSEMVAPVSGPFIQRIWPLLKALLILALQNL